MVNALLIMTFTIFLGLGSEIVSVPQPTGLETNLARIAWLPLT